MSDNRWQRVEDIFHRAVELAPQTRFAFLDKACGADQSLRREVESLLAHDSEAGSTFAGPAGADAPQNIAHYRIAGKLGQGGMGVVYRATDTKLGREVAIKRLPRLFSKDADRLARFTREAKVLASLNHTNIAQIYGLEEDALVMELVPGHTLRGPLQLETALNYARQIAEALEAAHEKGIIHRDLKPANIMVTPAGVVKVLDFGLAAVTQPSAGSGDPSNSPTSSMRATQDGMIIGTAGYMSPEQAAGQPVDKRTDIWAFGVVLYEMLTGQRLFAGDSVAHILADVLRAPINFAKLPPETPRAIRELVKRCLDRDVKTRLRDIGEAHVAIQNSGLEPDVAATGATTSRLNWVAWGIAALLLVIAISVSLVHFREDPPAPEAPLHFQIQLAQNAAAPVLSPDGRKVAFLSASRLWVHFLESGESRDLMAAAGGAPFWSPDSRFIGFPSEGKLKKVEAIGGSPLTVTDIPSNSWGGGSWNQDDIIVFCDGRTGSFRVPASGGVPVQIAALDPARHENSQVAPAFLPDGRHFVYLRSSTDEGKSATYVGSLDARPEEQSSRVLVASNSAAKYTPSADPGAGYLLFFRGATLMAQPFDNRRLELKGQAEPAAERGKNDSGGPSYAWFSVSANAILVERTTSLGRQLTWVSREGKVMGTVGESGEYFAGVRLSPDGTRLGVSTHQAGDAANLWLLDLSRRGGSTRFTFGPNVDINPVWSPDGSRIIFNSNRDGAYDLYQKLVNGEKDEEVLLKSGDNKTATSWSSDGRFLLYTVMVRSKTKNDVWVLPLENGKKPVPFLSGEFNQSQAHLSPDDHWVAYTSDESGQPEIYVRSFSMNAAGTGVEAGGKWQISNGFGVEPRWRGDGRELYYRSLDGRHMAVEIATHPAFRTGPPQLVGPSTAASWDVSADGRRFLFISGTGGPVSHEMILNWQAGLKK